MLHRAFFLGCAAAIALSSHLAAQIIGLNPSKDNSLHQLTNPSAQTSNGRGDIFVGRTNQDGQGPATISIRRGLIAFDVAGSVPAGATITGVSLTMRDVMGLNGDPAVTLHRVTADWGEGTSFFSGGQGAPATQNDATWLYRLYDATTPANSTPWTTPGGDFSPTASASAIISDDLGAGQLFTWSSATNSQMLADVQNWLDNPSSNFGWLLLGDESRGQSAKRLNSRESTTAPNTPPLLQITYVEAVAAVPEPASIWMFTLAGVVAFAVGCRVRRRTAG